MLEKRSKALSQATDKCLESRHEAAKKRAASSQNILAEPKIDSHHMAGENYAQGGKHEDLISVVYQILQQYPSTLSAKGTPFRKRQKEKTSLPASNLVMTADLFLPIHEPFAWKHACTIRNYFKEIVA